jgi:hypothetical protein
MALHHSPTEDYAAFPAFHTRGDYSPVAHSPAWRDAQGSGRRCYSEDSHESSPASPASYEMSPMFPASPVSPLTIWSPLTAMPPRRHETMPEMSQNDYFGDAELAPSPVFARTETMPVVRRQYTALKVDDFEQGFTHRGKDPYYYDDSTTSPTSPSSPLPRYDWKDSNSFGLPRSPPDQKTASPYTNSAAPAEAKRKSRLRRAGRRMKRMSYVSLKS